MNDNFAAFAAGAIVGRASARRPQRRAMYRSTDPQYGLSGSQRRVALAFGQVVGCVVSGLFLGYEIYVSLFVWR